MGAVARRWKKKVKTIYAISPKSYILPDFRVMYSMCPSFILVVKILLPANTSILIVHVVLEDNSDMN